MRNQFLANSKLNFIIFGGKGGSGKTTSACAAALYLGQRYKDKEILVVSTDPAPSVGDSFNVKVGNKVTQIKDNVWALEFDTQELMRDFQKKNLEIIKTLAERGTYLDREDIEAFTALSLPGMDEMMAVIKIADILKTNRYKLIILDTAPTGHTKVLLSLPKAMKKWLQVMDLMNEKHRFMMRRIRGKYVKDECDKFLEESMADLERVEELLKNSQTTEFIPVTLPEPMSILETKTLIQELKKMNIKVKTVIINRVISEGKCQFCKSRMKEKEKHLRMIEEKLSAKGGSASGGKDCNFLKVPLFPTEVRGKIALNKYAQILFGSPATNFAEGKTWAGKKKFKITLPKARSKFSEIPQGKMADFLKKDLNFIICGGKGGVGKTSIAAASAIALAKKYKNKKILITTTDPAHALSNIFIQKIPLDTTPVSIKGFNNLFALEIDAQKRYQDFKAEYKKDIKELFEKFTGPGVEVVYDKQVLEELMELSPPGLEELMALGEIMDLIKEGKYDIYILDSAASGHLLRFLELPGLVRNWLNGIFKILHKYQGLKLEEIAQKAVNLSKDIRQIQETLFGSAKTEFIMIAIPEEMGIREMGDLAESLKGLNVNWSYIIANFVQPENLCNFCLAKRDNQEHYLNIIKKQYPEKFLILIPVFEYDVRGMSSLKNLAQFLYGV